MIYLDIIPVKDGRGRVEGYVLYRQYGLSSRLLCLGSLETLQGLAPLLNPDARVRVLGCPWPPVCKSRLTRGW